jgi:DNA polymerase-3 subunit delta'
MHTMLWPDIAECLQWLQAKGLSPDDAGTLLRAAGGRPEDALLFAQTGRDPAQWRNLPKAMARGDVNLVKDWAPSQLVDALQKICHDLIVLCAGGSPRFFQTDDLPAARSVLALTGWGRDLAKTGRSVEHPFNTGLMIEALVNRAQTALNSRH